MKIIFTQSDSIDEFKRQLEEIIKGSKSILILSCDENNYNLELMNNILSKYNTPIFGGIFPQIIYKNKAYKKGVIFISLDDEIDVFYIENYSKKDINELNYLIEKNYGFLNEEIKTMFVFIDGLSKSIDKMLISLFDNFGLTINYIGAGTGSLSFEQKPSVFTNKGLLYDAMLLATSKLDSSLSVKHGWDTISSPFKITYSSDNILHEIEYENVVKKYKSIVETLCGKTINSDNFYEISQYYPFGINKLSGEVIVRDLIKIEGDSIIILGNISENCFISILNSDEEKLIKAAKIAKNEVSMEKENFTFVIDCISRALILEDSFQKELDVLYEKDEVLVGALTLGEIANNKNKYLEFYNKTIVVSKIEKKNDK